MNHPAVPDPWEFALLALAAFRITRLIGWDTLTEPIRERITGAPDDEPAVRHPEFAKWVRCPWCQGAYTTGAWWLAWLAWPEWTLGVASLLAMLAAVGLVAKQLDP